MNLVKNYLLVLAFVGSPLIAMDQELPQRVSFCTKIKTGLCLFLLASQPAAVSSGSTYRDFNSYRRDLANYATLDDLHVCKTIMPKTILLLNQLPIKKYANFEEFEKAWDEIRIIQDIAADCGNKDLSRKALIYRDAIIRSNKN